MIRPVFAQVEKAVDEMIEKIKNKPDKRLFLLFAPTQGGKTAFIERLYARLKEIYPNAMGLYVVAHNHTDFVDQIKTRIEHLEAQDLYFLSLRERRLGKIKKRPLKSFQNDPIFIFFDENHFGDGCEQTIDRWLKHNGLYPIKQTFMIGVSATPFSSALKAKDTTVHYSQALMPSYKSVTMMLKNGDIEEATPIMGLQNKKLVVFTESPSYQFLEKTILENDSGYCLLRIPKKKDALFFEKELKKKFGKKVFIRHWNQENPIDSPGDYLSIYRANVVTIIIVQCKARMGSTLNTALVKMVYDYSPNGAIATVVQGLLGRACGHGKIDHKVKVFSHLLQAQAYSLFENGKIDEFSDFVLEHELKTSPRSKVELTDGDGIVTKVFDYDPLEKMDLLKKKVLTSLTQTYGSLTQFNKTVMRTLSENNFEGYWYEEILDGKVDSYVANKRLLRDGDSITSILIDNREAQNKVYATFRLESSTLKTEIVPKENSIYSKM